ncbi:unnamed protein product [Phytophthora fragariaefolia]|uniref:Unnamed protein product n=1 Tax=Phytophthora fragariaefolia TaxID=1490495 RepID=A0A9W7D7I7_9STRA|nr:unnamed protein product [Phytophthora fragariaefolia]
MPFGTSRSSYGAPQALQLDVREIDAAAQDHEVPREFVKIRCRLNGGLVPLDLNLADLRDALGLPSYDLRPPYQPPLASSAPTVNMEDEDHMLTRCKHGFNCFIFYDKKESFFKSRSP